MREGLRADVRYARRCCCVFQRVHSNSSKQLCTLYICSVRVCYRRWPMSPCLMNARRASANKGTAGETGSDVAIMTMMTMMTMAHQATVMLLCLAMP